MEKHETHKDVMAQKNLPHVGDIVKSKRYGTLWKVIEEKEVWHNIDDDPVTGEPRALPAIDIHYCKINRGDELDTGNIKCYHYTMHDNTFEMNWERLSKMKNRAGRTH